MRGKPTRLGGTWGKKTLKIIWALQVLKSLSVLDSTSSVELDLIADAARQLFGAPIGLISLVDRWVPVNDGVWYSGVLAHMQRSGMWICTCSIN